MATMDVKHAPEYDAEDSVGTELITRNASGHPDQLKRQYGLFTITGVALEIDNAWVALAGSIAVSIANGGPAGVLYELLVAGFYYMFIAASIAELTSSIPSAGGVYHWASITPGPRYGRTLGFFAGFINYFGWVFGLAALIPIPANIAVQMYALFHPDFVIEAWHVYIAYVIVTWGCCALVIFGNRLLPAVNYFALFMTVVGGIISVIICAAMATHADSAFVWSSFSENNITGWPDGFAFLTGVLNGAFTIGTPDAVTKMSEELPHPKRDMPKAILLQVSLGTITAFLYAVAILYSITDLDAVLTSNGSFPLAVIYLQATKSVAATFGLLFIILLSIIISCTDICLTVSRMGWALARDKATPFSKLFSSVNEDLSCPVPSTVLAGVLCTGLGAIQIGSKTAFTDLVGSFVILTTTSYAMAIIPHMLTRRKNIVPGPFWLGRWGYLVNGLAVFFIIFFDILFCFPYTYPAEVVTMNYNSVILVGLLFLTVVWWFAYGARHYPGPRIFEVVLDGTDAHVVTVEDQLEKSIKADV